MAVSVIGGVLNVLLPKIFEYIPNPAERAKLEAEIYRDAVEFERSVVAKQSEITQVEAQSDSLFKSGPRPAAMWVCVATLAYNAIQPLCAWVAAILGIASPPQLDGTAATTLLVALLGLGAYRTVEKVTGAAPSVQIKKTVK